MNIEGSLSLYHGSEKIIRRPDLGEHGPHSEFGPGFYCTQEKDLAKEWACRRGNDGYANSFRLDPEGLTVLDLTADGLGLLRWLALVSGRRCFCVQRQATEDGLELLRQFSVDLSDYDVIVGWRADNACFALAQEFLDNAISLEQLRAALALDPGSVQLLLRSRRALDHLDFVGYEDANAERFDPMRRCRDELLLRRFQALREKKAPDARDLFLTEILEGGVTEDDPRLQ